MKTPGSGVVVVVRWRYSCLIYCLGGLYLKEKFDRRADKATTKVWGANFVVLCG